MDITKFGFNPLIPQLQNDDFFSRTFHTWKLQDIAKIAELENQIAQHQLGKMNATLDAMTAMATFGDRIKASMENVELQQRVLRSQAREAEAKARILETEAKKEEYDFSQYVKANED